MRQTMHNRYINDIILEYERSAALAEENARIKRDEVYRAVPRIKAIDAELSHIGIEIAQAVLKKDANINDLIEKKRRRSMELKIEKAELLTANSFPQNFAAPKYRCGMCKDTGYVGSKKCSCFKQRIIDKYYDQSNLKGILKKENFDTFVFDYYSPRRFESEPLSPRKNIEEIFAASVNFVNKFDSSNENLFFYGKSGLGKTFLSNCIAKDLLDRGKLVIYETASNLIDVLKDANFQNRSDGDKGEIDDIFECDLLIIDDLGTEYKTEFSQMELYNVINGRLLNGRKMLVSTNFSLDNIYQTYAERITSRIFGNFTMYKFYGDDIRLKIGQQKRRGTKKQPS